MTCNFTQMCYFIICARPLGVRLYAERHVSVTSFNESINVRKGGNCVAVVSPYTLAITASLSDYGSLSPGEAGQSKQCS